MKNKYFLLVFITILIADDCIENWINNNPIIKSKSFIIDANVNQDIKKLFYDSSERLRIESKDNIIISNNNSISKFNIKSKELIIDKSDEKFNAYIISLLNIKKFKRNMKLISKNIYSLKNKSVSEKTTVYFNENCDKIDSIRLYQNEYKISINNISIDTLSINHIDSLFQFQFNKDEVIIYDFRNQ